MISDYFPPAVMEKYILEGNPSLMKEWANLGQSAHDSGTTYVFHDECGTIPKEALELLCKTKIDFKEFHVGPAQPKGNRKQRRAAAARARHGRA